MDSNNHDWSKPYAMALPKEGYFQKQQGIYGPQYPKTPACYGFTVIAKVKPGREAAIREYGKTIEAAIKANPFFLAPLKLHYLKWVLFDVGNPPEKYFMYNGIFDTDFDKYIDDAIMLFNKSGIDTVFTNLEGFPEDWKSNNRAVAEFFHKHHRPSFMEYGEYPFTSGDEVKKALKTKRALGEMLDQMQ